MTPARGVRRRRGRPAASGTQTRRATRVNALLDAANAQVVAGSVDAALRMLQEACHEAEAAGDDHLQSVAQLKLGGVLVGAGIGRHQQAELALFTAIDLAGRAGDRATAASAYRNLAASDVFRGLYGRVLARPRRGGTPP